jgi:membrane-associated protein
MVETLLDFLRTLTTPERLIHLLTTALTGWLGYALLFGIVFSETGLLVGFFLPGDSLMFTVGVVAGAGKLDIVVVNFVLMAAAIIGDGVGYSLGRRTGPHIFNRPNSRFFHQEHLLRTKAFYERHGGKTIIYARFVPIIRTFAPFVAGVAEMGYIRFLSFNVFGGIGWVFGLTTLGYVLGNVPLVRRHFEKAIIVIIFLSITPMLYEAIRAWRGRRPACGPRHRGGFGRNQSMPVASSLELPCTGPFAHLSGSVTGCPRPHAVCRSARSVCCGRAAPDSEASIGQQAGLSQPASRATPSRVALV